MDVENCYLVNFVQNTVPLKIYANKLSRNFLFCLFVCLFVCLFELILYVPVNSYGHVGTLPPFYWTSTQHQNIMTPKMCFNT